MGAGVPQNLEGHRFPVFALGNLEILPEEGQTGALVGVIAKLDHWLQKFQRLQEGLRAIIFCFQNSNCLFASTCTWPDQL